MTATNTNQPRTAQPFGDRMTTRPIIRTIALWTAIILGCALFVLAAPPPADAATVTFTFEGDDFLIPRPEALAPIGQRRLVATYDAIANGHEEFIGSVCTFVVTAANGSSVHLFNQGFLTTNGSSTDILRTEDEPDVLRTVLDDPTLVLGKTVELYNIIGAWAEGNTTRQGYVGTSVDYKATATCQTTPDDTTTTTAPPTSSSSTTPSTTTSSSTTTTLPPSTSSTTSIVTTTTAPTDSTTTTMPPSTSTTVPGSSTSTTAPVSSTTSSSLIEQDTTTTVPPTTDETLPFTGPPVEAAGIAMAAVAALLLGGGLLMAGRES